MSESAEHVTRTYESEPDSLVQAHRIPRQIIVDDHSEDKSWKTVFDFKETKSFQNINTVQAAFYIWGLAQH